MSVKSKKGIQLSKLLTDRKKETKGVWREYIPGLRFLIGSADQPEFRNYLVEKMANTRRVELNGDSSEMSIHTTKGMARWLLLGWEGLTDEDLNDIKYSVSKAEEILTHSTEIHRFVDFEAVRISNFRVISEGEDRKN